MSLLISPHISFGFTFMSLVMSFIPLYDSDFIWKNNRNKFLFIAGCNANLKLLFTLINNMIEWHKKSKEIKEINPCNLKRKPQSHNTTLHSHFCWFTQLHKHVCEEKNSEIIHQVTSYLWMALIET